MKSKLICDFEVTPAHVHDSQVFDELLNDWNDRGQPIYADSANNKKNNQELNEQGFKLKILKKGYRNKALTKKEEESNRQLSSKRCRGEHVFARMRQRFGYYIRVIGETRVTAKITL